MGEETNKKDAGTQCRHDMRYPSSYRSSQELTVRSDNGGPGLQWVPEPPLRFLISADLERWPFELKIGTPVTTCYSCTKKRSHKFFYTFCFQVGSPGHTDRQTNKWIRHAMRPRVGWPHMKKSVSDGQLIEYRKSRQQISVRLSLTNHPGLHNSACHINRAYIGRLFTINIYVQVTT